MKFPQNLTWYEDDGSRVSIKFSQEFVSQVSWQKVDERTGAEIPEEDITDGADDKTLAAVELLQAVNLKGKVCKRFIPFCCLNPCWFQAALTKIKRHGNRKST